MREQDIHEREYPRVEADLAIWVVKKTRGAATGMVALVEDEEEQEGEVDVFENLESVAGRLLDISEGGAAIRVDLDVQKGDAVEFWSADNRIVLSELTAGVVSVNSRDDGESPTLHLHFIDPDLRELRLAIADIKARVQAGAV